MATLDSIDRKLLAELQDEGRVTKVDLAKRVGLTAPPCLRRVRALEEEGVIKGYQAELRGVELGDRKSTRLNSSHCTPSRMPSSA